MKDEWSVSNRGVKTCPLGFHSVIEKEPNVHRKKLGVNQVKNAGGH